MAPAALAGLAFGALAERLQLCTMGAVADVVVFGSWRRAHLWGAMIFGVAVVALAVRLAVPTPIWSLPSWTMPSAVAAASGGLLFGAGMVLAGGCVSSAWLRAASGSLRSLAIVVIAGLVAWPTAHIVSAGLAPSTAAAPGVQALAVVTLLLAWLIWARRSWAWSGGLPLALAVGMAVGLAALTAPQPLTEGLRFLPTAGADPTPSLSAITLVLLATTALGAALSAAAAGRLRLRPQLGGVDAVRVYAGAALMGLGGGLAGGCTIAVGTLGVGLGVGLAWIALAFMIAGAALVLSILLAGGPAAWLRSWRATIGGST